MEGSADWFSQGLVHVENKEYDNALAAFDRAIMYNQSCGEAWYNRGLVCMQTGNYDQALHSFDQALLYHTDDDMIKKAREAVLELMKNRKNPAVYPTRSHRTSQSGSRRSLLMNPRPSRVSGIHSPIRILSFSCSLFSSCSGAWEPWHSVQDSGYQRAAIIPDLYRQLRCSRPLE
ncbi:MULTISPECIES: tetratricopeptide repeat protein [unclassified Methanoregula]|uniref:tetratricopeptide repeat protein n=1 Tax=unclassified Methanoregula TaxID=2649730 RepID=UPI003422265D